MCIHTQVVLFQGRYHLPYALHTASVQVPYSGKLLRDKLSWSSRFCGYLWKIFPQNLGVCHFFGSTSKQSLKVFQRKSYFHQFVKVFSHEVIPIPYMGKKQPPNQTSCHSQGTMVTASQSFTQLHNQWRWFGHLQTHSKVTTVYCGISYSFRYATTSQLDSSIYGCRGEEWVLSMLVILSALNHVGTVNK